MHQSSESKSSQIIPWEYFEICQNEIHFKENNITLNNKNKSGSFHFAFTCTFGDICKIVNCVHIKIKSIEHTHTHPHTKP